MIHNLKEFKDAYWSTMSWRKTKRKDYVGYLIKSFPSLASEWDSEIKEYK